MPSVRSHIEKLGRFYRDNAAPERPVDKTPERLEIITREPETETKPTPILFIHGAWSSAW